MLAELAEMPRMLELEIQSGQQSMTEATFQININEDWI